LSGAASWSARNPFGVVVHDGIVAMVIGPGKETVVVQPHSEQERRIVVGVDGSVSSKAALAWAIRQAQLTGAAVDAVIAWNYPGTYGYPVSAADDTDYSELAATVIADTIAKVSGPAGPVEIRPNVVEGNTAAVLLAASKGADLLVVGSRGHGGFVEALLGSVSQHCVHHATCPVVIIRDSAGG
jgi:nucleotide-binding universal stress UspA family protein